MKTAQTPARIGRLGKPRQLPPALPFKVFIGYADLPAVRRATSTSADAIRVSGRRFQIEPMLWRFEQLASAHWRDRAVQAALQADVIVLAASEPAALGTGIEQWVDSFLAANRGRRATLVAVAGASDAWTISIESPAAKTKPALAAAPASSATSAIEIPTLVAARG